MSKYSNIVYNTNGSYLYGPDSTAAQGAKLAYRVDPMLVKSVEFGKVIVAWKDTTAKYTRARLVRNQDGFATGPDDGVSVWSAEYDYGTTHGFGGSGNGVDIYSDQYIVYSQGYFSNYKVFVDGHTIPLTAGKPVYYTMFLFVDDGTEKYWVEAGKVYSILPKDHGTHDKLMNILPKVYTSPGRNPLDEVDPTSDLYKFLGGMSYTLEELLTYVDLLMPDYSQHLTPAQAVPLWRSTYSLTPEPVMTVKNQKALIREALYNYSHKGTSLGLGSYVESLTGFTPEISVSNLLPSLADSTFYKSTGNWVATNPSDLTLNSGGTGAGDVPTGTFLTRGDNLYSAKVTAAAAGNLSLGLGADSVSKGIPVTPGKTYNLTFYAKVSTGSFTPVVTFYDYTGTALTGKPGPSVSGSSWAQGSVTSIYAPKKIIENVVRAVRVSPTLTRYYAYPTTSITGNDVVTIRGFGVASLDVTGKAVASVDPATNSFVLTVSNGSVPSGTDVTARATASNAATDAVYASIRMTYSAAATFYLDMVNFQEGSSTTYHEARGVDVFLNPTYTNYVKNPSFESYSSPSFPTWSSTGTLALTQDSSVAHVAPTSSKSAKLAGTGAWTFYTEYTPASTDPVWKSSSGKTAATALNNKYWTASLYIKSDVATTLTLRTVGGTAVTGSVSIPAGDWSRKSVTLLVPYDYTSGTKLQLVVSGTGGSTYLDCVQLQVGHLATEYFDGSLPVGTFGVVWDGGVGNANNAYSHLYTNKLAAVNRLFYTLKDWAPRGSFASISTYGGTAENGLIDLT